jgi:hypothetical protein
MAAYGAELPGPRRREAASVAPNRTLCDGPDYGKMAASHSAAAMAAGVRAVAHQISAPSTSV